MAMATTHLALPPNATEMLQCSLSNDMKTQTPSLWPKRHPHGAAMSSMPIHPSTTASSGKLIDERGPISGIKLCLRPIHIIHTIYATTTHSHDDDDSPACSTVIRPCTTCMQPPRTATATTRAQHAPNAGMTSVVPSGLSGTAICLCTTCMQPPRAATMTIDDSLACIQHASHSLTSMVPSWVSSSVVCPCTTQCMQPPRATTTTTARHSPNVPQHVQQRAAA
ncbi:hypothetical protein BU15DRAFT_66147 [Melanogaster broomeanus]|nr:hypothetical protein BU15DRAFT_66147 [Melanogaster broomeanus]